MTEFEKTTHFAQYTIFSNGLNSQKCHTLGKVCLLYYKLLWYLPKPQREYGILSVLPSLRALLTKTCPREMKARDARDNIRKFSLESGRISTPVWVRHTYDVLETPQSVSFMKKRGIKGGLDCLPPPLYDRFPIPIKKAKADDVRILVTKYIPASHQDFYSELPVVDADGEDSD